MGLISRIEDLGTTSAAFGTVFQECFLKSKRQEVGGIWPLPPPYLTSRKDHKYFCI